MVRSSKTGSSVRFKQDEQVFAAWNGMETKIQFYPVLQKKNFMDRKGFTQSAVAALLFKKIVIVLPIQDIHFTESETY